MRFEVEPTWHSLSLMVGGWGLGVGDWRLGVGGQWSGVRVCSTKGGRVTMFLQCPSRDSSLGCIAAWLRFGFQVLGLWVVGLGIRLPGTPCRLLLPPRTRYS